MPGDGAAAGGGGSVPPQRDLPVADGRLEVGGRAGHGDRRGAPLVGGVAFADVIHRPHLEGVGDAVGQAGDREAEGVRAGGDRCPVAVNAHAGPLPVLVPGDGAAAGGGSAPTVGRNPTERDLPVADGRLAVDGARVGHGDRYGGGLDGAGAWADGIHRPYLEVVGDADAQA